LKVLLLSVSKGPVVVEICLGRVDLYGFREVYYCVFKVIFSVERNSPVVISVRVVVVDFDGLCVVNDGLVEVSQFIVGKASVEESFKVVRENLQGF
jgi:hypothetical protein